MQKVTKHNQEQVLKQIEQLLLEVIACNMPEPHTENIITLDQLKDFKIPYTGFLVVNLSVPSAIFRRKTDHHIIYGPYTLFVDDGKTILIKVTGFDEHKNTVFEFDRVTNKISVTSGGTTGFRKVRATIDSFYFRSQDKRIVVDNDQPM